MSAGPYEYPSFPWLELSLADAGYVFAAPARWDGQDWLVAGGSVLGIAGMYFLDGPVRDAASRNRNGSVDRVADWAEELGSGGAFVVMGGIYLGGMMAYRPALQRTALDAVVASAIAGGLITPAIKYASGRARPRQDLGTHHFDPFGGDVSFPSGHTTQAFALASVVAESVESSWLGALSYTLAGVVGLCRIYHGAHFASDVAAGAVIGTATGVAVVRYNRKSRPPVDGPSPVIVPTIIQGIPVFACQVSF